LALDADNLPLLAQAADFAQRGFVTGASERNWLSYSEEVKLPPGFPEWRQRLLTDPQTSGGLLVSCAPERAEPIEQMIIAAGYPGARTIGFAENGKPIIRVMAS
jgi:selenide, water dikinase